MNAVIIACRTLERELLCAIERIKCPYPVRWIESGLHNVPKKLNLRLQEVLDSCGEFDTVLLAMGFCGNSLIGLKTGSFRLVIPKADDCISLVLGQEQRRALNATYFLTDGWLKGERNIWVEYQNCMSRYGQKQGREIFDAMFAHYRFLALVDTGAYDPSPAAAQAMDISRQLGLEFRSISGSLEDLENLLLGNWFSDTHLIIPPGDTVRLEHCMY